MARCSHSNLFFREKEKKALLSDDKHFPWLLKNDINVAGVWGWGGGDTVVTLAAKGLGQFQGTQYPRNISCVLT